MDTRQIKNAHFVGIGGINMSAVAKLLLAAGVRVSGSDVAPNDQTEELAGRGAKIVIGHAAANVPSDIDVLIYTSAATEENPERGAARERGVPEMNNFQFCGEWFRQHKTILVVGTHGKSTTTAMLGLMAERAKLDPTVVVGSKVPSFPDGNLRIGASDLCIVEGDEYAKHFLEFSPHGVVLNNIEWDHTDIFPTLAAMMQAFRELLGKMRPDGILVANVGDPQVKLLLDQEKAALEALRVRVISFNTEGGWKVSHVFSAGTMGVALERANTTYRFVMNVCGGYNAMNAAGAALMAMELGATYPGIAAALESFKGIWRRFELVRDKDDIRIYSDYGHHPTAVRNTLEAAKELSMNSRVLLCFQPHHRNRTKHLFLDFVPSFDLADALILCEIYDVAGRDEQEDADISSHDLVDAVVRHDADRGATRAVEYAKDPTSAIQRTLALAEPGDVVIVMGAGDIDAVLRNIV